MRAATSRLLKIYFPLRYFTQAAKAAIENMAVIAELKLCATQQLKLRRKEILPV